MDTSSIITQLMQIEARPQQLLQQQLANVTTDAAAYRDVNTSFAALESAASALTQSSTWTAMKASSSDSSVAATATAGAAAGSLTFSVTSLAAAHSMISSQSWGATTSTMPSGSALSITQGSTTTVISTDGLSLSGVVDAINQKNLGLTANVVKTGSSPDAYQLQITANSTGSASAFQATFDGADDDFGIVTQGANAAIKVGTGPGAYTATSPTNTFTDVLPGSTFTVSQQNATATVSVASDSAGVTSAVKKMVDAANAVIGKISSYTDSSDGSTAPLKGDWSLISLANDILSSVSSAVGTSSAGLNGLQTTKDGTLTFDVGAFTTALQADPAKVQSIFGGLTGVGADNVANTPDDTIDVDGIGARLLQLANRASDSATGSLTVLANGEDSTAKDLQAQIDDWTTRLQDKQQQLQDQFNAMETALGSLQSQSSWLTSQINSLSGTSSSSKK
jgi:flagellar hook-associated protein 2